jgi:4-diphosphocytidyl-2-C-methyl-D-erythritol kinase
MLPGKRSGLVRVKAFAKINLTLRVLGRRPDGYHDLRTAFQSLALHDRLAFRAARGPFRIECDDLACPVDRSNLVWRAAEQAWRAAGRVGLPRDVSVSIEKRIPMQAGLGGGSSDAAATLSVLTQWWGVKADAHRLLGMASELGADVPFFLEGGTTLGLERGSVLYPLVDFPPLWVVLAMPAFGVRTADAYSWFDLDTASGPISRDANAHAAVRQVPSGWTLPAGDLANDLEPAVAKRHPTIRRLVGALERRGASYASMSGSGSAVFGLFRTRRKAQSVAAALARPTCRTIVTKMLGRDRYRATSGAVASLLRSRRIG